MIHAEIIFEREHQKTWRPNLFENMKSTVCYDLYCCPTWNKLVSISVFPVPETAIFYANSVTDVKN
jgi:hypothetical protein